MPTRRAASRTARRPTVSCRKVLRAISRYLDNDLPASGCDVIKKHLDQCLKCDRFVHSLRRTINLCRKTDVARLASADKTKLRNRILAAAARL